MSWLPLLSRAHWTRPAAATCKLYPLGCLVPFRALFVFNCSPGLREGRAGTRLNLPWSSQLSVVWPRWHSRGEVLVWAVQPASYPQVLVACGFPFSCISGYETLLRRCRQIRASSSPRRSGVVLVALWLANVERHVNSVTRLEDLRRAYDKIYKVRCLLDVVVRQSPYAP